MTLPKEMRFVNIEKPGEPEVLQLKKGPLPDVREDEILIKVHAAGVNYPDLLQRKGLYPPPPTASPILGLEVAGEVIKKGSKAHKFEIGDHVCALTNGGGYAEYTAVPQGQCLPLPEGLTMTEAASLPEVYFTVWLNVFQRARLKKGEHFLVQGGSGGIGSTAVQLAKAFGATVSTTCGTEEHCLFAKKLGADQVINYKTQDFVQEINQVTHTQGVNVILDYLGGDYFEKHLSLLKKGGRLVEIAALKGNKVQLDILQLLYRRLTIMGSALRPMTTDEKAHIAEELVQNVWPLFKRNIIHPVVSKVFPFEEVINAHTYMESKHIGKVVLQIRD